MLGATTYVKSNIDSLINAASIKYGIEAAAIRGVIEIESNFNPMAYRYEAHLKDASWGLMQILLATARDTSGNKNLTATELVKPEINVDIGSKYLAKQYKRYNANIYDAVAAYNAGSVRKTLTGSYVNQTHVDRFKKAYLKHKGLGMVSSIMPIVAVGIVGTVLLMKYIK